MGDLNSPRQAPNISALLKAAKAWAMTPSRKK
jgi:hypothetical protein